MDGFDRLPDSLILLIFNSVSDIKTLLRCRAVSRRFNTLVPQTESLLLKVDCVVSPDSSDHDGDNSFLFTFLRSVLKSLHDLVSPNPLSPALKQPPPQNSPSQILRGFDRVRDLVIELPSGDMRLEKGAVVKWTAEFGNSLRSCVILGFRAIRDSSSARIGADSLTGGGEEDFARGLKTRVVWTISALIAASARHYFLREVVREQRELRRLVLTDREGEGTVVMDEAGLADLRGGAASEVAHVSRRSHAEEEGEDGEDGDDDVAERNRTRVPSVRMRMRHAPRLELKGGFWAEGATLVLVRPTKEGCGAQLGDDVEDTDLATRAFGEGLYGEAVGSLLKNRSYILEMNSF